MSDRNHSLGGLAHQPDNAHELAMASDFQLPHNQQIRRPRQKRSQERFEAILDAAERMLNDRDPAEVSIYTVAEEAGMSPPSIYHFFPDSHHVFVALAERYFEMFESGRVGSIEGARIERWQDWVDARYGVSRRFYNENNAARKVILGAGSSWAIRSRDLDLDHRLAAGSVAEMNRFFIVPQIPGLIERVTETIVMNDALWALANHRYGSIPDEADEYAARARIAHMRTYLPEYLPIREGPVESGDSDAG